MTDLSMTIAPKSDQINADDLIGGPRTITVTRVTADPSSAEQPIAIFFQGDNGKPYKPCKSMRRVMVHLWGKDGATYAGRSMTLYRDQEVQFGGMKVGGIRISHMTHIEKAETMALTATRANRRPFTVKPLEAPYPGAGGDDAFAAALEAANKGTTAFTEWWNSEAGKQMRAAVRGRMQELRDAASKADEAVSDDPFGLPPSDGTPGEEDHAAAEAAAKAAAKAAEDGAAA